MRDLERIYTKPEVDFAVSTMRRRILMHEFCPIILVLMKGGIWLARELGLPTDHHYVPVDSDRRITLPRIEFKNRDVLVIDDIVDSGETMRRVIATLTGAGAKRASAATLCVRARSRALDISGYFGLFVRDNRFLVGCGMDLDGKHRDLNEIYVVKE